MWTAEKFSALGSCIAAVSALGIAFLNYKQAQTFANQLRMQLASTRPFMQVAPTSTDDLRTIVYLAIDRGTIPARLVFQEKHAWVGGTLTPEIESRTTQDVVFPDLPGLNGIPGTTILRLALREDVATQVANGLRLELAACLIYESVSRSDARRWRVTARHMYSKDKKSFDVLSLEDEEVLSDTKQCAVAPPSGSGK